VIQPALCSRQTRLENAGCGVSFSGICSDLNCPVMAIRRKCHVSDGVQSARAKRPGHRALGVWKTSTCSLGGSYPRSSCSGVEWRPRGAAGPSMQAENTLLVLKLELVGLRFKPRFSQSSGVVVIRVQTGRQALHFGWSPCCSLGLLD
jgi:hypothetical protein